MTVFNNDHHDNAITRAAQKKSGVPYYISALETSSYNIDFFDTSVISTNSTNNSPAKTESDTLTWKDWFKFLREQKSADIDNTSYNGNTVDGKIKNAAEYFRQQCIFIRS